MSEEKIIPQSRIEKIATEILDKVTPPPAPVPTGTINISENGEYDVSEYATANVNTPVPSGTLEITENGEYDVSEYATANVAVPSSGKGTIPFSNIFDCIESSMEVTKNA